MANLTITKFQENNVELKRKGCKNENRKECGRYATCTLKIRGTAPCIRGRCQRYKPLKPLS